MKVVLIFFTIIVILLPGRSTLASEKISPRLLKKIENASPGESFPAWIYFTDKGNITGLTYQLADSQLLPRARERRMNHHRDTGSLTDFYDLPLEPAYVGEVLKQIKIIRQKSRWLNAVSVEAASAALFEIAQMSFVKSIDMVFTKVEPLPVKIDPQVSFSRPSVTVMQNLNYGPSYDQNNQINVIPLHNQGYNGAGILVAMLDAGFNNLQHQALRHLNILATWDFVNGDSIVWDEPGQMGSGNHGTYTLSALAGFKEGSLIGPAYGADFLLAKTENTDWERHLEEDAWIAGAEWADSLGARIISSSLGYLNGFTNGDTNYTWQDMDGNSTIVTIGADIAASRGILVVNSAGNEGPASPPQNSLIAPSDGDSVLAVGSVTSSSTRSSFSSMGPTADGRIKPDVMARGSQTWCATPLDTSSYWGVSGTSLSCPLVAGAVAVVWQTNPGLTNMEIIEALRSTASRALVPDNEYGWGIIDAYQASLHYTRLGNDLPAVISGLTLHPIYPNPFNPVTTVAFDLPENTQIAIVAYNIAGEKVADLYQGPANRGSHRLQWNAQFLASGMYYIVLQTPDRRLSRKALLLK